MRTDACRSGRISCASFIGTKSGQRRRLAITINRYPLSNEIGGNAVAQRCTGHRYARLQASLDDLSLKGF